MATRSLRRRTSERGESTLWSLLTLTTCVALVAVVALTVWVARRGGHLEPLQLTDGIHAAWGRMRGLPAETQNVAAASVSSDPSAAPQPVAEGPSEGAADDTEPDETAPPVPGAPPKKVTKKPPKKKATKKR